MLPTSLRFRLTSIAAEAVLFGVLTACASHVAVGYRVYDPYYTDYHVWGPPEVDYYNRWNVETHRPANRDFRKLHKDEQKQYWDWRHKQGGDHDHDHDRH